MVSPIYVRKGLAFCSEMDIMTALQRGVPPGADLFKRWFSSTVEPEKIKKPFLAQRVKAHSALNRGE